MKDNLSIINELDRKIEATIARNNRLVADNKRLLNERERLIGERGKHTKEIEELKKELKASRLACDMSDSGSRDRARKHVKSILREIDVCIELINKKS